MKIFAIADLHFDGKKEKPMNIFGDNWINHEEKIVENWKASVENDDLVLIPGDISWAVKLDEAVDDLRKIDSLPGVKIIGKGNHDYWWSTSSKLNKLGLKSIRFLKNNSYEYGNVVICGTRGWESTESTEETEDKFDKKIFLREINRLRMSLESARKSKKIIIVMLHYPPFDNNGLPNEFFEIAKSYKSDICIYGHLHGEEGHKNIKEGMFDNVSVHCVSSDYMDFKPKRIM
jgi:hypothetical protein